MGIYCEEICVYFKIRFEYKNSSVQHDLIVVALLLLLNCVFFKLENLGDVM